MSSTGMAQVTGGPSGLEIFVRVAWDTLLQLPGMSAGIQPEASATPTVEKRRADALTPKQWRAIERLDQKASAAIVDYKAKRAEHYQLRQSITATPTSSGLLGLFSSKGSQRKQIEKTLAESLEGLREYFQKNVQPWLRHVWSSYGGKTFTVTPGTRIPPLLKLASLPKEKEGKVISVEYLRTRIEQLATRSSPCKFKVAKHGGPLGITMTRQIGDSALATLRFEQRRPGVVNVYLNDKRMVFQGKNVSLYTDDALKLAEQFSRGAKSMTVRQGGFTEYVIGSEAMFLKAQRAMEKADEKA